MNNYFITLTTLALGHMIADFPLQTGFIYQWKIKSIYGLLIHALLHSIVTMFLFQQPFNNIAVALFIGASHCIVDWVKIHSPTSRYTISFLIDQGVHGMLLALVALWKPEMQPVIAPWFVWTSLVCMVIPFLLMFLWMMSNDMERTGRSFPFSWDRNKLLHWSKQSGWIILVAMLLVEAGILMF